MTSPPFPPSFNEGDDFFQSSRFAANRYSIQDYGQGYRMYSYEFDLIDYEPEQITVLLSEYGRLRISARRPFCHEFRREYELGGPDVQTRLVRNTIDTCGRLRIDVEVQPRPYDPSPISNNILTFDLHGYRSKNVNVRINENGLLKVNAQQTDESIGHQINREYYRQYQLPKHITPDQIRARIDENQILTIELPEPLPKNRSSWPPYQQKNYSSGYGKKPNYHNCCCVM